ncbi:hypothetical protein BKA70DRAFT_598333 [Coprinopsis sp. MPI-PUGE-AT-0042]|nr:hypothetical protein BKA70DRAFT_598333 [Coprinopsis sp. MPI-PUGE-AT-0042]
MLLLETQMTFLSLMGGLGDGKSTLIKEYTGDGSIKIYHTLQGSPLDVAGYPATIPPAFSQQFGGRRLVLVDTPGFDDVFHSDSRAPTIISRWLARWYFNHPPIVGVICLHDITLKRYKPSHLRRTIEVASRLCGNLFDLDNIVLATSQWDALHRQRIGELRQDELRRDLEVYISRRGLKVMSVKTKPDDQQAIIDYLLCNFLEQRSKQPQQSTRG